MKKLIVVDVSNFIFRACFAIRPLHAPDGTPVNAVYGVLTMFLKLLSKYRPTHILMAKDTAGGSFRNDLYSEYKANRTEPPEDLIPQFALIRELLEKMNFPIVDNQAFEADDIIGTAVTKWKDQFDEILIASGDKDLMQFVGGNTYLLDTMKDKVYDSKGVFEKMGVRPDQIVDYLSMVGDTSDNIPGMKGIGAKGAAKLLAEHETLDNCIKVKETFTGKKLMTAFNDFLDAGLLSRSLIKIVTDIEIDKTLEDISYKFYPTDELIAFLERLGFNSQIKKLMELRQVEFYASEEEGEEGFFVAGEKAISIESKLVNTKKELEAVLELIDTVELVSLHTEYDCGDIFERKISSCTISTDGKNSYFIPFSEDSQFSEADLKKLLVRCWSNEDIEVASEHWKRDCFFAHVNNYEVECKKFDITQAHYILDSVARHEIHVLANEHLHFNLLERPKKDPFLAELSLEEKMIFCGHRCGIIFQLTKKFKEELIGKELEKIYNEFDRPMIDILSRMEIEGISIDENSFHELDKELENLLENIKTEVAKYTDGEEVNLNSPKQVGELLFTKLKLPVIKKTKTGFSTDSEVLETLDGKNISPVPGLILQHREMGKLLSTYVKTLPNLVHQKDSRIHTHFNQHVAATGRLASNNPNLQNIPIRTEMGRRVRKGFVAKKGHVLLGADYSQIELRLLAHLSGDPVMIKAFQNGEDIHRQTASEIMGVSLSEVTTDDRSKAKAVNFGLMYGQSSFGLAAQLKISRKEAKEYITNYFENFSRVKSYLDGLKEEAEKHGYAITMHGRKRFLPDLYSKNRTVKAMAERVAINSPIQGTAADIIKLAMINIDGEIAKQKLSSRLILQVHDELIFEVPEDEIRIMKELVKVGMENVVSLSVPLTIEMGTGINWYELK